MALFPYLIHGTVFETNGSTALANVSVRARNERTNETLSNFPTSDSNGQYILDIANFSSGYIVSDVITIYVIFTNLEKFETHTVTALRGGAVVNLTLTTVSDSDSLRYVTIQDILDYGNFTVGSGDKRVETNQIVKITVGIEEEIDDSLNTRFDNANIITQEYHDMRNNFQDTFFLRKPPIQTLTTFQVNKVIESSAPVWTTLTEAANEIELDSVTGRVKIVSSTNLPSRGDRQVRVTYTQGRSSVPKEIRRLTILMVMRELFELQVLSTGTFGREEFQPARITDISTRIEKIMDRYRQPTITKI